MTHPERTPVDRLARGYVREEMRKIQKNVGNSDEFIDKITTLVHDATFRYFSKQKTLPEGLPARLRKSIEAFSNENLLPFARNNGKYRVNGLENIVSNVDGYYYLNPMRARIINPVSGVQFDEECVEVRHMRVICNRKHVIVDDSSCHAIFSTHALTRLVERDACEKEPLKYLTTYMGGILACVPLFTLTQIYMNKNLGVIIPVNAGALMGEITLTPKNITTAATRWRLKFNRDGYGFSDSDDDIPFKTKNESIVSIRINTFMDNDILNDNRTWAKNAVGQFLAEHEKDISTLVGMVTIPEFMSSGKVSEIVTPIFAEFKQILKDPRWTKANNHSISASLAE